MNHTHATIPTTATLLDAMRSIDVSSEQVALVVSPDGVLQALVTDGDIRRAILAGKPLTDLAIESGSRKFTSVASDIERSAAVALMLQKSITSLPVVDAAGKLVDLITLRRALSVQERSAVAVIMAGGKGERLGELTSAMPKPMLPIGGKPILEHLVNLLVSHGVRRIYISVNYLGRMIEDHFGDGTRFNAKISYLREDRPLGTGGALSLLPAGQQDPVLVMNGDLVTAVNLGRLLDHHVKGGFAATIALREHVVKIPFGVVDHARGQIQALKEKPTLTYSINAGIYAISPELLPLIPGDRLYPITELFDRCLHEKRPVGAWHLQETWDDVGLPEEYARVGGAG